MPKRIHSKSQSRTDRRKTILSNRWAMIGAVFAIGLIIVVAWYFNSKPGEQPLEISAEQAYREYQQGAFFLDVRTQGEWDTFHIPGATLIPLDELAARLDEVPRDRLVVVVCRSGSRSQPGRDILLDAGFTSVTSMTGGLTAWSSAGYPIDGTRP